VHEVTHHLESFLTREEIDSLEKQFAFEKSRFKFNANDPSQLSLQMYRFKNWQEWWAHTMEDRFAMGKLGSVLTSTNFTGFRKIVAKLTLISQRIKDAVNRAITLQGRPDIAGRTFKNVTGKTPRTDYWPKRR
jgi:hypothetical protein